MAKGAITPTSGINEQRNNTKEINNWKIIFLRAIRIPRKISQANCLKLKGNSLPVRWASVRSDSQEYTGDITTSTIYPPKATKRKKYRIRNTILISTLVVVVTHCSQEMPPTQAVSLASIKPYRLSPAKEIRIFPPMNNSNKIMTGKSKNHQNFRLNKIPDAFP